MKRTMFILVSVVAVVFLAVAILTIAADNNPPNTSPQANNGYSCCGGAPGEGFVPPCANYGAKGGKGMFKGRRGMCGGWNCPGPWFQNAPQKNQRQGNPQKGK